jgi:glycosyltransferase involved in cell wall biosynthesis
MGAIRERGVDKMSAIKISVVMPHYKRAKLLDNTLKAYTALHTPETLQNVEFIVVDDSGNTDSEFWEVIDKYSVLNIKAFSIDERTYVPVIPFNFGIRRARGEVVVLAHTECLPSPPNLLGNIATLSFNMYISCACYSIPKDELMFAFHNNNLELIARAARFNGDLGWYNHSKYNPRHIPFTAAIRRQHLIDIRGFDEDYAYGSWRDDIDLIDRLRRKGLELIIADGLIVFHQWHYDENFETANQNLIDRNKAIYESKRNDPVIRNDENWGTPKGTIWTGIKSRL